MRMSSWSCIFCNRHWCTLSVLYRLHLISLGNVWENGILSVSVSWKEGWASWCGSWWRVKSIKLHLRLTCREKVTWNNGLMFLFSGSDLFHHWSKSSRPPFRHPEGLKASSWYLDGLRTSSVSKWLILHRVMATVRWQKLCKKLVTR